MYQMGVECVIVLHQFLLDLLEGRLAFQIELLLFLILGDEVEVIGLHLVTVCLVFLESPHEAAHLHLECFLC